MKTATKTTVKHTIKKRNPIFLVFFHKGKKYCNRSHCFFHI